MRCLKRNKRPIWYALYLGTEIQYDTNGNELPSPALLFDNPKKIMVNVSASRGSIQDVQFGLDERSDKVIVTDDVNIPLTDASRLWVDVEPVIKTDGTTETPHDYVISKIGRSLTNTSIAISKVDVT